MDKYNKYLDYYDVQRYNEDAEMSDLTIQRIGGDDLSLLTEIVVQKQNTKLFSVPDNFAVDSSQAETLFPSNLSQVNEILSEAGGESPQKKREPRIKVVAMGSEF